MATKDHITTHTSLNGFSFLVVLTVINNRIMNYIITYMAQTSSSLNTSIHIIIPQPPHNYTITQALPIVFMYNRFK